MEFASETEEAILTTTTTTTTTTMQTTNNNSGNNIVNITNTNNNNNNSSNNSNSNNNNKRPADIDSTTLRLLKEYEKLNIHQFADGYVEENYALYDFEYEAENGIDGSDSSDSDSGVDANSNDLEKMRS